MLQIVLMDIAKKLKLECYPELNDIVKNKARIVLSDITKQAVMDEFKNMMYWRLRQKNYGFFSASFEYDGSDYGTIHIEIHEGLNSLHRKNETFKLELVGFHLEMFITDLLEVNL